MTELSSDIAFTDTIKAIQAERGSRKMYARREAAGGFETRVTPDLAEFLATIDTAYLASANARGQPYAQHRGGPPGFIRPVDDTTVGFADFMGNRQYITTGNLIENDQAFLFLMDYARRRRVKLWGRARVTTDPATVGRLAIDDYAGRPEQAILFEIAAWDVNCPQHIPAKFPADDVMRALDAMRTRAEAAEAEVARLRAIP